MSLLVAYAHVRIYLASQQCITSNHYLQLYLCNLADSILAFLLFPAQLILLPLRRTFWWAYCDAYQKSQNSYNVKKYLVLRFH